MSDNTWWNQFAAARRGEAPDPYAERDTPQEKASSSAPDVSHIDESVQSVERPAFGLIGTAFPRQNLDTLIAKKGMSVYTQMRLDEQVKAVCTFKRDAILSRGWHFEFDKESKLPEAEQKKRIRIFEKIIEKMPGTFIDALNCISTGREYGYSLTEKVYTPVEIDGVTYFGLDSLRGRDPSTFEFTVDPFGDLVRCQQIAAGQRIEIDLDKFIHYVHNPEFDVYLGRSDLREAYTAWYFKTQMMKFWALYMEKLGGGALIISIGPTAAIGDKNSDSYKALKQIAENFKASSGMVLPKDVTATLEFPTSTDAYDKAITSLDLAIARALLVPNLLGVSHTGQTGAYAQSQTQLEAFAWTLKADADRLESCINEQLFYDLGDQNFGDGDYPCFRFKPSTTEQVKWLVTSLKDLITAGALIPTEDDEQKIRQILEMPPRTADSKPLVNPQDALDKEHELSLEKEKTKQAESGAKSDPAEEDDPAKEDDEEAPVTKKEMRALLKSFGYRPEGETTSIKKYGFKVRKDALDKYDVTEDDWGDGEDRDVAVSTLIATQDNINKENLDNVDTGKRIVVLEDSGQRYILDGHHRAAIAARDGETKIAANVLEGSQYRRKKFAGDWDESKHPRADNGRFGEGSGEGLTEDQAVAVDSYRSDGYKEINAYIAGKTDGWSKDRLEQAEYERSNVEQAIQGNRLENDTTLYRGFESRVLAANAEKLVGKEIGADKFVSTSPDKFTANAFAGGGSKKDGVLLEIKAPKGTPGLDIRKALGRKDTEPEILLSHNAKFKITGVDRSTNPVTVSAEVVQ